MGYYITSFVNGSSEYGIANTTNGFFVVMNKNDSMVCFTDGICRL